MSLPKTKVRNAKELQLRKLLIKGQLLSDEREVISIIPFSNLPPPAWLNREVVGVLGAFLLKRLVKKILK